MDYLGRSGEKFFIFKVPLEKLPLASVLKGNLGVNKIKYCNTQLQVGFIKGTLRRMSRREDYELLKIIYLTNVKIFALSN